MSINHEQDDFETTTRNIHTILYNNIKKILGDIPEFLEENHTGHFEKTTKENYWVVFKRIDKDIIFIGHYYDLCNITFPDFELTVKIDLQDNKAYTLSYKDEFQTDNVYENGKVKPKTQRILDRFTHVFLLSLKDRGL